MRYSNAVPIGWCGDRLAFLWRSVGVSLAIAWRLTGDQTFIILPRDY